MVAASETSNIEHGWRGAQSTVVVTWLALAAIIALQAQPFTYGFRRSADEIDFLVALFGGWRAVEEVAISAAAAQGRLGFLAVMPLNAIGAYLADSLTARWGFALLHFGTLVLFAAHFSIISRTDVTRALLIILVSAQTIGGIHDYMPPISYPLQNTLPILALLVARCTILMTPSGRGASYMMWSARIVFLLAILTTEYAFLLGSALLAAEYSFALARRWRQAASPVEVLLGVVRQRAFLYDAAMVVLALCAYLAYRWLHPSGYTGNVIDAGLEIGRVAETTMRHILAGTILSREMFDIASLPRDALPIAVAVGILTATCMFAVLYDVRGLPSPLLVALGAVLAMAYVTFPLAGNARQQSWCVDSGACGYLDSRISFLGFAVVVICVIALALRRMPTYRSAMVMVAAISGTTGLLAAATYARNLHGGLAMAVDAKAWERAALLACYPEALPAAGPRLLQLIDPERSVRFHPGADKAKFWREYMSFLREDRPCPVDSAARQASLQKVRQLGPVISVGKTIYFTDKSAGRFLGDGWSGQESRGIWSVGEHAKLAFLPRFAPGIEGLQLRVAFRPYVPPSVGRQTIGVSVNGRPVTAWTVTKDMHDKGCCERSFTLGLGPEHHPTDEVDVTFHVHHPRDPARDREIIDNRRLGLFLREMTLGPTTGPAVTPRGQTR